MTDTTIVVKYYNHFGAEIEYTQEQWENYYTGPMREYIGSAIQFGDKVGFHGNMDQGSLTVHDGSETVSDSYWMTEEVEFVTQDEIDDMDYDLGDYDDDYDARFEMTEGRY